MKIDRTSCTPSYIQIANQLKALILSGTLSPGSRLPAESALVTQSNLSRITVRKGLEILAKEGWLVRKQGLGTFVRNTIQHDLSSAHTLNEVLLSNKVDLKIKVLSFGAALPPKNVRIALKLNKNEKLLQIERLYLDGSEPMALVRMFLPLSVQEFADTLRSESVLTETTYTIWEQKMGIRLKGASHSIRAGKSDKIDAIHLGLKIGEPVLILDRITYAEDGRPVEYLMFHYQWQHYQFSVNVPRINLIAH